MGHYLLLIPLFFVGYVTVRDDLREGRIYNKRILQGLVAGAIAYLMLGAAELMGADPRLCSGPLPEGDWHWGAVVVLDLGVALFVGVLLWMLGIWAAGDAKLFTLYAFLVPPTCFERSYLSVFPALPVLVNVFVFVFLFLLVDLMRTSIPAAVRVLRDPESRSRSLRQAPMKVLKFIPLLLVFVAMFAGIRTIREVSREGLEPILHVSDFTLFLVLFVAFKPLSKLVMSRMGAVIFTVLSLACLGYIIWAHGWMQVPDLIKPSAFAVVLLVFARAYPALGQVSMRIKLSDLRRGMMLSAETLQALKIREKREEREAAKRGEDLPRAGEEEPGTTARPSRFGEMTVEGLTDEQIRYMRTRWKDDEPLAVARTVPFSPFLAAGALVSFFFGGPLTIYVQLN